MKKRQPKILTLAILTTLTILTWVSFEVWRSFTKQNPVLIDSQTLKPLDPTLDTSVIGKLAGELYLPDSEGRHGTSSPTVVSTPIPEETPAATTSATPKTTAAPSPAPTTPARGGTQ